MGFFPFVLRSWSHGPPLDRLARVAAVDTVPAWLPAFDTINQYEHEASSLSPLLDWLRQQTPDAQLVQSVSTLGFPNQITYTYADNDYSVEVKYDGILFHCSEVVTNDEYSFEELRAFLRRTPLYHTGCLSPLEHASEQLRPKYLGLPAAMKEFFTIDDMVGFPDLANTLYQLHIPADSDRYYTGFVRSPETATQIAAHNVDIYRIIQDQYGRASRLRDRITQQSVDAAEAYKRLVSSWYRLDEKWHAWRKATSLFSALLDMQAEAEKLGLFERSLSALLRGNPVFISRPSFRPSRPPSLLTLHSDRGYGLSSNFEFWYEQEGRRFQKRIRELTAQLDECYTKQRDLVSFTSAEAEMYGMFLAVLALIVALIAFIASLLH